ncbi:MAG TPA: response regulator transcription factor [Gemmatimonadales bacterium]|nr:response regulator transcription factor [Gemmatimonadales bacterium]
MEPSVILADDYPMVRQGFRALLERHGVRVVGEAEDGRVAVRLARELQPDVAVLDLAMPGVSGLEAARQIRRTSPRTQTILLTVHSGDRHVLEALRAGVRGYVLKTQPIEDLHRAIIEVAGGAIYLSPGVSRAVVDAYLASGKPPADRITFRERHVLQLIAEGKTTKEIAALLGVSVKTVEAHRARMMKRLGIHTTAGLVRYAIREGVVSP